MGEQGPGRGTHADSQNQKTPEARISRKPVWKVGRRPTGRHCGVQTVREAEILDSAARFHEGSQWLTELCRFLPIRTLPVWPRHFIGLSLSFKNGEFEQKEARLPMNVSFLLPVLGL